MSAPKFFLIRTTNAFTSWTVVRQIGTGNTSSWSATNRPKFVEGPDSNKFITITPATSYPLTYISFDGGASASYLSQGDATWQTTALFNLECDGVNIFYANGTDLRWLVYPTNNAPGAFTNVTSKFSDGQTNRIKKFANRYVAWGSGNLTTVIQTSTTLTGTYTSTTWTGFGYTQDIVEVGTKWFANSYIAASTKYNLVHTSDAVSPAIPVERSFVSPALCTTNAIVESYFPRRYGTGTSSCYFLHSAYDMASTTNGTTFTAVYRHKPRTNLGIIKKYGYYFAESNWDSDSNNFSTFYDFSMAYNGGGNRILYRSTDMKTWEPLFVVRSGVYDLGTRLYVLQGNAAASALQSTDGVTWNTTGITEPSGQPTNKYYVKVIVCNGLLFRFVFDSSGTSSHGCWVSSNQGLSWSSTSLSQNYNGSNADIINWQNMLGAGSMAFFKGRYYHIVSFYDSSTNQFWLWKLAVSTDGITWTYPFASSGNWTSASHLGQITRSRTPIVVAIGDYLYMDHGGWDNNGSSKSLYRTQDGISWEWYDSVLPDVPSAYVDNSQNFATENGPDVYFVVRSTSPYLIYKNGTLLDRPIVGMTQAPGTQVLDDTNEFWSASHIAITKHTKTNVTFTMPNITSPSETFMRVKR